MDASCMMKMKFFSYEKKSIHLDGFGSCIVFVFI
jgi:hypothetical protein